ncbi:MAG: cyclase family protein [Bacillota bacterium]
MQFPEILYDISMDINPDMDVYKGKEEKRPIFKVRSNHKNSSAYETVLTFDMHTGTHIDAPLHMIEDGATMDYFKLENIFSQCVLIDLTELDEKISKRDLIKHSIEKNQVVIFKTKNTIEERVENFIYLAEDGAEYLLEKEIRGVGIDTAGIERDQEGHPTHKKLLSGEIFIIEGLKLKGVPAGIYNLLLVPLKINNVEAAPARALLLES